MKHRPKLKTNRTKALRKRRAIVRQLAAQGINGDAIAARLGVNKNTLRAEHALDLEAGRQIKAAAKEKAAGAKVTLTKDQELLMDAIESSFASHWFDPEFGNLLFHGARMIEEAIKDCQKFGHFQGFKQ
jgi:hypothetical protein